VTRDPSEDSIVSEAEAALVRAAARVAEDAIIAAASRAVPGATTIDLNTEAARALERAGAEPLFAGYAPDGAPAFPAAACVSVNEEVVHGVPGARVLAPGDLVTIDVGARLNGWCADAAVCVVVPGDEARAATALRLMDATRAVLEAGLAQIAPGVRWSTVARAMEEHARAGGFGIVTEFVGHGVGRALHVPPRAPAYATGFSGEGFVLREGMVLAVEPILTAPWSESDSPARRDGWATPVVTQPDGWTVVTRTGELACHEERMVLVTRARCEVLTPRIVRLRWGGGL